MRAMERWLHKLWERLADIKESYPVQAAEYAVGKDLVPQPTFTWSVPYTLKKRDHIISAVNSRYFRRTHKFGIELPNTIEEALHVDKRTNTTYWRDAIAKEMKNVSIAFDILEGDRKVRIGFQFVKCHFVFDIKLGALIRKARL
jgi:hypothetical protein